MIGIEWKKSRLGERLWPENGILEFDFQRGSNLGQGKSGENPALGGAGGH